MPQPVPLAAAITKHQTMQAVIFSLVSIASVILCIERER